MHSVVVEAFFLDSRFLRGTEFERGFEANPAEAVFEVGLETDC